MLQRIVNVKKGETVPEEINMRQCECACKEIKKGPKEWEGMTNFRIAELDVLRGLPGHTNISFVIAKDREDAIEKYYRLNPGASDKILIYPEGCATVHTKIETRK